MDYPKALYKSLNDSDMTVVNDEEEEKAKRDEGYDDYLVLFAAAESGEKSPSIDELKEEAIELGIEIKGTWGVKKLSEVIAAKKAE